MGIEFEVGVSLNVQLAEPPGDVRCKLTVCGWDEDSFILTEIPSQKAVAESFRVGDQWLARYIVAGKAFGFKTEVIKVQFDPKPLLFLRYPAPIEALTIRQHERINTFIVSSLSTPSENGAAQGQVQCIIRDLSKGGCLIDADTTLSTGDKVVLSFLLPNGERVESIPCEVRNVRTGEGNRFTGGVMFSEGTEQRRLVDEFFDGVVNSSK